MNPESVNGFDVALESIQASLGDWEARDEQVVKELLAYPGLRSLLIESGHLKLRMMQSQFNAAPKPLYEFVEDGG